MNTAPLYSRLLMLGAAPETRGSVATVVDAYRAHGLFKRWPVEYVPVYGDAGVPRDGALALQAARRIGGLLLREGRMPVHVHLDGRSPLRSMGAFVGMALVLRCPLILHLHGVFEGSECGPALRAALERAAAVIVPCEATRAWVKRAARLLDPLCLPPPVATVPATGADEPHASRPNVVLFLGRLEAEKGIFDLLEAIAALRPSVPDVRLVCAGDGRRIAVAAYAERLGIADAVKFTGWVGPSGKRALLETAAVLALPSYGEGLPLSLLEAMATGVPAVASAVGGVPDVLVDGVSGQLIAPGDRATLERHLRRLLLDRALGARLGAAARETARLRFAPERALARLESLYAALGVAPRAEPSAPTTDVGLRKAA